MNKLLVVCVLMLAAAACAPIQTSLPSTATSTITSTAVPPTATPLPSPTTTSTPDAAATQKYTQLSGWVEKLVAEGILPDAPGQYIPLGDHSESLAKPRTYHVTPLPMIAADFVLQAKVRMQSASKGTSKAGCGFVFLLSGDNSRTMLLAEDGNVNFLANGYPVRSNYLDASLPSDPQGNTLTLVVYNNTARLYVNDRLGLFVNGLYYVDPHATPQTIPPGALGPSVLSGSDQGFGTRCDFTDFHLWLIR